MNQVTPDIIWQAIIETAYMVSVSLLIGTLLGLPLALLLVLTRPNGIKENKFFYAILNTIINIIRSLPFIILLVAIVPFTRLIVGKTYGTEAAIVPLIIYIAPFIARLVETSLLEVNPGIIELAKSLGAKPLQIVRYFLVPEALASIILTLTTATIGLIGATAMAGTVGGGGIGNLAISYGYQRFNTVVIILTVVILIVIVQIIQSFGNFLAKKIRHQ
ncbi:MULTISPECIES: methionine ABC transporter permease [Rummeliibacillus]|jgi:ABC-type metal ion transport system, permease component|uniref:methionine ABC transporter permease n=1 Tax=Rummeliibacillus TaxID=648802 RepID=UPI0011B60495|nr:MULTISPECIES: methionine ABC transporter permease [Rummeliibacillus]MBO2535765.1 ABC transporter permease [Rummeliibacillus suwonensis]